MIWTASRICWIAGANGSPCHWPTMISLDRPSPSVNRPGARCASVAAACPYTIGARVWTGITPLAIRSLLVCVAITLDTTMASAPEASLVHAVRYPRASASRAIMGSSEIGMTSGVIAMSTGMGPFLGVEWDTRPQYSGRVGRLAHWCGLIAGGHARIHPMGYRLGIDVGGT